MSVIGYVYMPQSLFCSVSHTSLLSTWLLLSAGRFGLFGELAIPQNHVSIYPGGHFIQFKRQTSERETLHTNGGHLDCREPIQVVPRFRRARVCDAREPGIARGSTRRSDRLLGTCPFSCPTELGALGIVQSVDRMRQWWRREALLVVRGMRGPSPN